MWRYNAKEKSQKNLKNLNKNYWHTSNSMIQYNHKRKYKKRTLKKVFKKIKKTIDILVIVWYNKDKLRDSAKVIDNRKPKRLKKEKRRKANS